MHIFAIIAGLVLIGTSCHDVFHTLFPPRARRVIDTKGRIQKVKERSRDCVVPPTTYSSIRPCYADTPLVCVLSRHTRPNI